MYAIVEISGKQYKVRENDRLYVPRQHAEPQETLTFDRVLLVGGGDAVKIGTPTVDGASVSATVVGHVRADKVLVFKKKRRKRYRVKRGHRQPYTQLLIDGLALDGSVRPKKAVAKPAEPTPAKPAAPKAAAPAAPASKAEAKPAPKAAPAPSAEPDDLTRVEGIGPKYASVLAEAGFDTYAKLAAATPERITEVLSEASSRYRNAVTDTWPEQAALAAKGDWDALASLQNELDGGRRA